MFFLEVLSRVVSIFVGIVGGLNGLVSLVQKCKPYIDRHKAETEKDPSASPVQHLMSRMMIAQAKADGLKFVTHDYKISFYEESCVLPV